MQETISKNSSEDDSVPDFSQLAEAIKIWGKEPGFQEVCIADDGADMAQSEYGLQQWLNEDCHGEMDYMAKHSTRRTRLAELVPGTLRVISVRMNYMPVATYHGLGNAPTSPEVIDALRARLRRCFTPCVRTRAMGFGKSRSMRCLAAISSKWRPGKRVNCPPMWTIDPQGGVY